MYKILYKPTYYEEKYQLADKDYPTPEAALADAMYGGSCMEGFKIVKIIEFTPKGEGHV